MGIVVPFVPKPKQDKQPLYCPPNGIDPTWFDDQDPNFLLFCKDEVFVPKWPKTKAD